MPEKRSKGDMPEERSKGDMSEKRHKRDMPEERRKGDMPGKGDGKAKKYGDKKVQVISLAQLEEKVRDSREELLFQSICRLDPVYWSGVKLAEGFLYGAFSFHGGQNPENRASLAAFLLGKEEFILAVIEDEGGLFPPAKLWDGEEQPGKSCETAGWKVLEAPSRTARKTAESQEAGGQSSEGRGPGGLEMEEGLEQFFERILECGRQKTEKMERYLIELEREIVSGRISRDRNRNIFECKRTLTVWKNDYGRFLNVIEGINGLEQKKNEGQEQVLTEESACFFRVYENKLKGLTEETQFLYEELVHIREALDAALSYEQNRIMKVFTTVTTVFMPLSLIAGWYGMNFTGMPELGWKYGYAFAGGLSVLVILVCIWFFKKKKLF